MIVLVDFRDSLDTSISYCWYTYSVIIINCNDRVDILTVAISGR